MPRSQRITCGFPPLRTYSADRSHSWIEVAMPRLSSTGFRVSATRRSSEKFWMLRAPIWRRRSEEHTSELQSHSDLVCRLLLEKKKIVEYLGSVLATKLDT